MMHISQVESRKNHGEISEGRTIPCKQTVSSQNTLINNTTWLIKTHLHSQYAGTDIVDIVQCDFTIQKDNFPLTRVRQMGDVDRPLLGRESQLSVCASPLVSVSPPTVNKALNYIRWT